MFQEKCYFVTHRIFTETSWCTVQRTQEQFHTERRFLCYYLPLLQSAADIDLVGECVQTLKYLGHRESEALIQNAVNFLLESRDESTVRCLRTFYSLQNQDDYSIEGLLGCWQSLLCKNISC